MLLLAEFVPTLFRTLNDKIVAQAPGDYWINTYSGPAYAAGLKRGVNLCDFTGGSFDVEKVASKFLAFDGQIPRLRAILQGVDDGVGNGLGTSRWHESASDAFLNQIRQA